MSDNPLHDHEKRERIIAERRGPLRQRLPVVKARRRQTKAEREAESRARSNFYIDVMRLDGWTCAASRCWPDHSCYGPKEAHHAIKQQTLRAHISTLGLSELEIIDWLWNPENGVTLCRKAHQQHSCRFRTVSLEALPARVADFARDRGVFHLLEREHPPLSEASA